MNAAIRVPYLALWLRSRFRAGTASVGVFFSFLVPAVVAVIRFSEDGSGAFSNKDAAFWREQAYYCLAGMEGVLLCWAVLATGMACGRERDSGRLLGFGSGGLGGSQFMLGLLVGPAWVEWTLAACASIGILVLEGGWGADLAGEVRARIWWWLGLAAAAVFFIDLQLPRPIPFKGHRIALLALALWFVVPSIGVLAEAAVSLRASAAVAWQLGWPFLALLGGFFWSHAVALIKRKGLGKTNVVFRLSFPPALILLLLLEPFNVDASSGSILIIPAFYLVLASAVVLLWDGQTYPESAWSLGRIIASATISLLAGVSLVLWTARSRVQELTGSEAVVLGIVVLSTLARLWLYLGFVIWVAHRFFLWQSFALTVLCGVLEIFGIVIHMKLRDDTPARAVASSTSVVQQWDAVFAALRSESAFPANLSGAGLLWPALTITALAIIAPTALFVLGLTRRRQSSSPSRAALASSAKLSASRSVVQQRRHGHVVWRVAQVSPLLAALAVRSLRLFTLSSTLPRVVGIVALAYLAFRVMYDACTGVSLLASEYLSSWYYYVFAWQLIAILPLLVSAYLVMRRDRRNDRMQRHAQSAMYSWQVALGYLVGAPFVYLMLELILTAVAVLLGVLGGQLLTVFIHQSLVWGLVLVPLGLVVLHESRPIAETRFLLPAYFGFSILLVGHFLLGAVPDRPDAPPRPVPTSPAPTTERSVQTEEVSKWSEDFPFAEGGKPAPPMQAATFVLSLFGLVVILLGLFSLRLRRIEGRPISAVALILCPLVVAGAGFAQSYFGLLPGGFVRTLGAGFGVMMIMTYLATRVTCLHESDLGRRADRRACIISAFVLLAVLGLAVGAMEPETFSRLGAVVLVTLLGGLLLAFRLFAMAAFLRVLSIRWPGLHLVSSVGSYKCSELFVPGLIFLAFYIVKLVLVGDEPAPDAFWLIPAILAAPTGTIVAVFCLYSLLLNPGIFSLDDAGPLLALLLVMSVLPNLLISAVISRRFTRRLMNLRSNVSPQPIAAST